MWLPRQVNSKTYHCIHGGDLSDGIKKDNPFLRGISFHPSVTHSVRHYQRVPRPLRDALATSSSLIRASGMRGDVRSPEGCWDGTLCAVDAELDRDGSADCMCLRVIPGSQQQQAPTAMVMLERHPHTKMLCGYTYIKSGGNKRTRAATDFTTGVHMVHRETAERNLDAIALTVCTVDGVLTTE